ncbi:GNAT family N-acetyltransferase [Spongiimicrobium salis]|uniref:GNAT family N-acetyltransferase n=1 Tax=Spongiimicrobium salis TaxID=1667022 RepID=UPI00374D3E8A
MRYLLQGEHTARMLFREVRTTDYEDWLPFFQNPLSHQYWVANYESPEKECNKWYARQKQRYEEGLGGMNALIERDSGLLVGHCGLLVQEVDGQQALEIGYSLLPQFWNKGFATEAAMHCRDIAFKKQYADRLISIISLSNLPSQQVALKNGMHRDYQTIYRNNPVYIFRIDRETWEKL